MSAEQNEVVQQTTALTLPERARAALGLANIESQLQELATKTASITSITNADGYKQVHAARMALKNKRVEIDKRAKEARDDANKFSRAIIEEGYRLTSIIEPEELRLEKLQKAWDEAREAERKAKAEAERQRVANIQADIEGDLRYVPTAMLGRSAADIEQTIRDVVAIEITADRFAEFVPAATAAKEASLIKLREMHARQVAHEAEQQRLAAERAELERQRLANEEAARNERERIAAEEAEAKRQREAEAAAAAVERQRKIDEEMAKLRAQREENERAAKAERERIAEERRQQEAAAAERQRFEQQRIEAERAAAAAERERLAEAQRKLEAERAELERQQQQMAAAQAKATEPESVPDSSTEVAEPAAIESVVRPQPISAILGDDFLPTRVHLVAIIAHEFGVSQGKAEAWLVAEFAK